MADFEALAATLSNLKLVAPGGQKVVYGAMRPTFCGIAVKLFFKTEERSQREMEISLGSGFDRVPKIHETGHVAYTGLDALYFIEQRVDGK
ncbi:MAG: hypothetical protein LBW85_00850 [Deltaproteobacteria bacterium]|jgi:hypothetical protein|nr:hypothetical protein [Deltaproteobacteria bacterium]